MKPPPFLYTRVHDATHAVERLAELGGDAKILAGGQSLLPMMSFRLVRPSWLVDVGRLTELRGVTVREGHVEIGALTRHRELAALAACPVLRDTVPLIGHEPIRTLGTFGGSVAHGDAASEWCALTLLLDGEVVMRSRARGERRVAAERFFHGLLTTELAADELLTSVRLRIPTRAALCEHAQRRGDFGLVLAAVAFDVTAEGTCTRVRVVAGGVDVAPIRLCGAEAAIEGRAPDDRAIEDCASAAAEEIDPPSDVHATAEDRRDLTAVLMARALRRAQEAR